MALLTNVTTLLVLAACISQQLTLVSCHARRATAEKAKQDRESPSSNNRSPVKGRFTAKDKSQCTWVATTGVHDLLTLGVTCKKGNNKSYTCEYVAKPAASCPQHVSNVKLYWKQIARALSKQKKLCQDTGALVKAGMCRRAPEDAHFRLNHAPPPRRTVITTSSTTPSPQRPAGLKKACKTDSRTLAQEHCNGSWSSFCVFLFSMVQPDGDC